MVEGSIPTMEQMESRSEFPAVDETPSASAVTSQSPAATVLGQIKELPSNVNSARIFTLPRGFVLVKSPDGRPVMRALPNPGANTQVVMGSSSSPAPAPRLPAPRILQPNQRIITLRRLPAPLGNEPRHIILNKESLVLSGKGQGEKPTSEELQTESQVSSQPRKSPAKNSVSSPVHPKPRMIIVKTVPRPPGNGPPVKFRTLDGLKHLEALQGRNLEVMQENDSLREPLKVSSPVSSQTKTKLTNFSESEVMHSAPRSITITAGHGPVSNTAQTKTISGKLEGQLLSRVSQVVRGEHALSRASSGTSLGIIPLSAKVHASKTTETPENEPDQSVESVKVERAESPEKPQPSSSVQTSVEDPKPKPTPWWREARPLWQRKEPVVMYSGAPPENLEQKKEKKLPPKSLPCPKILESILPQGFNYHISHFEEMKPPENFKAEVRINIFGKEDALEWLKQFEDISGTNYRVQKTFRENSSRVIFKKVYKCQRNTHKKDMVMKRESPRHVGCEARLSITIKNVTMKQSADLLLPKFPCVIGLYHTHCHSLTADSLRYRRPLPEIREKFADMYRAKITPSAARRVHMADLKRQYGDKYSEVVLDGARCPPLPWCYRLYYETCGKLVKDGKKKSTRKSSYKRKINPQRLASSHVSPQTSSVVIDFNLSGDLSDKPAQEEMQRSINSLYEYEFMSKNGVVVEHDVVECVEISNSCDDNSAVVENNLSMEDDNDNEIVDQEADSSHLLTNDELLSNVQEDGNFMEGSDFLDNEDEVSDDASRGAITGPGECQSDEEVASVTSEQRTDISESHQYSTMEVEGVCQEFQCIVEDINLGLKNQPEMYVPLVKKFTSAFKVFQQSGSGIHLENALGDFGSDLSRAISSKPATVDQQIPNIGEGVVDQNHSLQIQSNEMQSSGSPKRKVLVLRMDPNKFNQIMGRVQAKKVSKELVNS